MHRIEVFPQVSDELDGYLSPGALALLRSLTAEENSESTQALVVEAARAKSRLDKLSAITSGDEDVWCRIFTGDGEVVLKLDTAVSEQRQLSTVFRQLLGEIQRRQAHYVSDDEEDGFAGL